MGIAKLQQSHRADAVNKDDHGSSTFHLTSLTAIPNQSTLTGNLSPSGMPFAYLQEIAITFWWSLPKPNTFRRKEGAPYSEIDHEGQRGPVYSEDQDLLVEEEEEEDLAMDDDIMLTDTEDRLVEYGKVVASNQDSLGMRHVSCNDSVQPHSQATEVQDPINGKGSSRTPTAKPTERIDSSSAPLDELSQDEGENREVIPAWTRQQIITALQRVVKIHLIK